MGEKVVFFGCSLDCDERQVSVEEKLSLMDVREECDDPYASVMAYIREEVGTHLWEEIGSLDVPGWLQPIPSFRDRSSIVVDNFIDFIDRDGCRTLAQMIGNHVVKRIFPNIPCMVAVDHALSGGVFQELRRLYAPADLSLIVFDSHTDAIPAPILCEAIRYDIETNVNSVHEGDDPFLTDRPDSFNASSFLHHLLEEQVVKPENLYIIGISDYPPRHAFRVKDPRIKRYTGIYSGLKKRGVKIITKKSLVGNPSKVKAILRKIETPYIYVSIDMDVGAGNAAEAVRFCNRHGISQDRLYHLASLIQELISEGVKLAGLDVTEFNPRAICSGASSNKDGIYRIAANLIEQLCFGFSSSKNSF